MAKNFLTPEEGADRKQLQEQLDAANARAAAAVAAGGMSSDAYLKADAEAAAIIRRIKEIDGTSGQHWMA